MSFKGGIVETETLIGIVLAIVGNVLISFALNIQKLAHNKLLQKQHKEKRCYYASTVHSLSSLESAEQEDTFQYDRLKSDDTRYLQSKTWWLGILLMVLGEMGNFMAYGFAPASTIAPLGTTTLVSNAILAPCLLNERFRPRDFFGVLFAVCGAAGVVWSSKTHEVKLSPELVVFALTQVRSFVFYGITISLIVVLTFLSPHYGSSNIFVDLGIVAVYGAYTVLATKSLSSLFNLTLYKLFTYPVSSILLIVLIFTAVMQIKYLNRALQRFDGVAVIPTQFVLFTISAIIGSAVIYRDFDGEDADHLLKFIFGCLIEFFGVFLITSNRRASSHNMTNSSGDIYSERHDVDQYDDEYLSNNVILRSSSMPSVAEPSSTATITSNTPLLYHPLHENGHENENGTLGIYSAKSSDRRSSSVFGGISIHSQLAAKEDDG